MNRELGALLRDGGGLVTRAAALERVPVHVLDWALRSGQLVSPLPSIYVEPQRAGDRDLQRRGALAYAGPASALSHLTVLELRGLPVPEGPVHVTVPEGLRLRRRTGLEPHRRAGFRPEAPWAVERAGLRMVPLERALVETWPLLQGDAARAPILTAVQDGLTTPARIFSAAVAIPNVPGRAQLLGMLGLVRGGCRSELEVWGYRHVFDTPALPRSRAQVPVRLARGTVYLDRFFERERVDVELDGAKWHRGDEQRERDLRRDAALAALGIQVVRFSHDRLHQEPHEVVRELLAILAARR